MVSKTKLPPWRWGCVAHHTMISPSTLTGALCFANSIVQGHQFSDDGNRQYLKKKKKYLNQNKVVCVQNTQIWRGEIVGRYNSHRATWRTKKIIFSCTHSSERGWFFGKAEKNPRLTSQANNSIFNNVRFMAIAECGIKCDQVTNHPWQRIMETHKSTPSLHFSVHVNGTIWCLNLTRLPSKGFHWKVAWRESGSRLDQDGLNGGSRSSAFRLLGFLPLMTFCKNRPTSLHFPSAATAAAASAPSLKLPGLANASNTNKNSPFLTTLQDFASYFPSRLFGPCF